MSQLSFPAVALMVVGMCLIPGGDTAGKFLTSQFGASSGFVAWSRFALGLLLLATLLRRLPNWALLRDWRIWLRGALISGGILSILTALKTEPIANVFGAFFVGPIMSYVLSVLLLKEPLIPVRAVLVSLGFVGVLLIVRPGFDFSPGLGFAVLAGIFYGSFLTASRWLSDVAGGGDLLLSQLVVGTILLAPIGLAQLPMFTPTVVALTGASALASGLGNLCLILAYRRAQASVLAPLVYIQLLAATFFGIVFFGDVPDVIALFGMALIVLSGLAASLVGRR